MRRWLAILLLCLIGAYLGATGADACSGSAEEACAPACHLVCSDGCAAAPVPVAPAAPDTDPLPRAAFKVSPPALPLLRTVEPEKTPPRG
jgi:hypothetical protein